jgi:hypothetical protein
MQQELSRLPFKYLISFSYISTFALIILAKTVALNPEILEY